MVFFVRKALIFVVVFFSDLQKNEKKSWVKKLEHFVETKASTKVLESIKKEQCVMITGPFGSGKSMTVFYVALRLEDVDGFDIMIVSDLDDIIKYATDKKKQLFVIDDMFGKYSLNDHNTGWWNRQANLVKQVLSKNVNMKLLMTSRSPIYQPTILDNIDLSYVHCSLISDNLKLTVEERRKIVQSYHSDLNDRLSDEVIMMYSFFPSLCGTLPEAAVKRYDEYFKIPCTFLFAEMQCFKAYDVDYIALALLVVKDDNVDSNILKDVNEKENNMLNDLSTELCHTICPHKQLLLESLSKLDGTYVKKTDNGFTCIYKNLFDIIAFCIGSSIIRTVLKHGSSSFIKERLQFKSLNVKHDPLTIMLPPENEDLYFQRLLIDMKKGLVWDVFSSLQSTFPEFREKLIAYMQKHRKVLYLNDGNNGSTVLHVAAAKGYSDYASFFIEVEKSKVNRGDKSGKIPLHLACEKGHFGMAKLLLDNRAFFDKTDNDEQTPLDIACSKGYSEIVNLLLAKMARIKQRNKDLRTALHVSANNGNKTITKLLLNHGAKVNLTDENGFTPLHLAAIKDHVDIINLLLEYMADIDCCDNTDKTPLFIACHKKKFSAASDLIKHQADINKTSLENDSPLHAACQTGCKQIVQLLLDNKVDYNQRNKSGNTPLHVACENGNLDCVGILLQSRSKGVINKGNKDKSTPLHLACQSGRKDVVTFLLENGASINQGDKKETTPLFESCRKGDGHITELLLQHGSDVNKSDKYGWTPLFISCEKGHSQIVASLLDHKADVNHADVDNLRPILIACRAGRVDILNLLLQCKADINVSDNDGVTPLSTACERNRKDIVEFLLSKEANVNQSDKDGSTSLHIACGEGYADLVDILLKYHASVDQADRFGQTPLFKSISIGNVCISETLLKKGASANITDRFKISPLSVASQKRYTEIVKIIRKYSPS